VPWSRPPHSQSISLPDPRSKAFQIQSLRDFFDEVPDLVDLDYRRAAMRRLGLGTGGLRVIPDPAQSALGRDPDALGHRVHRQAQAIKLDRVPLHLHRLAARRGARELPAAARALALPALPAAGMAGPDPWPDLISTVPRQAGQASGRSSIKPPPFRLANACQMGPASLR
jgi:hypothetical protein